MLERALAERDRRARAATRCWRACCRRPRRRSSCAGSGSTRGRRLGLAQPVARQRDQVLRPPTGEARPTPTRPRSRSGCSPLLEKGRPAGERAEAPRAPSRARSTTTCASSPAPFASTSRDCGSSSTAPTAPPTEAAPAIFERLGAEVGGDRRRARRAQHQRGLRLDPSRGARRAGRGVGRDRRLRLRRRRRPRRRRRRQRPRPRRRRADRARRAPPPRRRRAAGAASRSR